jgi:hypothetical protein
MIEVMDVQKSVMKRLYYFTPDKYASDIIKNGRLKVSRFLDANDPFELRSYDQSDRDFRRKTKKALIQENERTGMLCFCRNWTNPVMWAHYAAQHKGVCYGFDVHKDIAIRVSYQSKRLPEEDFHEDISEARSRSEFEEKFSPKRAMSNKSYFWKYEKEVRVLVDLFDGENSTLVDGLFFRSLSEQIQLKKVILGCRSVQKFKDVEESIHGTDVKVIRARPAFRKFHMTPQRDESLR